MAVNLFSIPLTEQEVEFASACKDFVAERDSAAAADISIQGRQLLVPNESAAIDVFFELGVARLIKVFYLAVTNGAIRQSSVPTLVQDLSSFNEKLVDHLAPASSRQRHFSILN
jgi:hypothetical protein